MTQSSDTRAATEAEVVAAVRDIQALVSGRGPTQPMPRRTSGDGPITVAHLVELKTDITRLIHAESARGSRSGYMANALFYVLGVATSLIIDYLKSHGLHW